MVVVVVLQVGGGTATALRRAAARLGAFRGFERSGKCALWWAAAAAAAGRKTAGGWLARDTWRRVVEGIRCVRISGTCMPWRHGIKCSEWGLRDGTDAGDVREASTLKLCLPGLCYEAECPCFGAGVAFSW